MHEVLRTTGAIGVMAGWIEHETLPTLEVFMSKMERYTRLAAEARVAENIPPRRASRWVMPPREVFRRLIRKLGFPRRPRRMGLLPAERAVGMGAGQSASAAVGPAESFSSV